MGTDRKRVYDSSLRRGEAAATRLRVIDAGRALLLERGYAGTTMQEIASRAGVSIQTIYSSVGGGKAALAKLVYDTALVGDAAPVPLAERAEARHVADSPDASTQLRRYAALARTIFERVGPVARVIRAGAASGDDELRALCDTLDRERRVGTGIVAAALAGQGVLRDDVDQDHAARVLFALTSFELADALTSAGGWTMDQLEDWLARTSQEALLGPSTTNPPPVT